MLDSIWVIGWWWCIFWPQLKRQLWAEATLEHVSLNGPDFVCSNGFWALAFVHRSTLQCIRTMDCEYALCSLFVPGDRQVIIGTKVNTVLLHSSLPRSGIML